MHNRILAFCITLVIFLSSCSSKNEPDNDLKKLNLKGDIDRIDEYSFKLSETDGKITKGDTIYFLFQNHFDANGNKTKDLKYHLNGTLHSTYMYEYDDKGLRIREALLDAHDSIVREIRFTYENGILTKDQSFNRKGEASKTYTYTYNPEGELIQQKIFNPDGSLKRSFTFVYNEEGKRITESKHDAEGQLIESYHFVYDEYGNIAEEEVRDKEEKTVQSYSYRYQFDTLHNWTEKSIYSNDKPVLLIERSILYR